VLDGAHTFTIAIVGRIALTNLLWLIGLAGVCEGADASAATVAYFGDARREADPLAVKECRSRDLNRGRTRCLETRATGRG